MLMLPSTLLNHSTISFSVLENALYSFTSSINIFLERSCFPVDLDSSL